MRNPDHKKVFILIPCYNEELNIAGLLSELSQVCPEYTAVVINDGSTDKTKSVVSSFKEVVLLDLPINLGVGGAVQTGLMYAEQNGAEFAVKLDGDSQHPPGQIKGMIALLMEKDCDLLIGSRFLQQEGFQSSFSRRIGIGLLRFWARMLTNQTITDPTSGFRAYNRRAIEFMARHYPSFDYPEPEEIVLARKNGLKLMETPVCMRERKFGESTISSSISVYYMFKVMLAMVFLATRAPEKHK